ncbi:MAG: hypothetical protein LUH47_02720 [Clostridiales bacterium]|nr:hypothetical protein [Clostridiales bacterium]
MRDLYRKSVLRDFSSSEGIDKAVVVSSPLSWLVIIGLFIIISAFVIWGFAGSLQSSVSATGIISAEKDTVICYFPLNETNMLSEGMTAAVVPIYSSGQKFESAEAVVLSVDGDIVFPEDVKNMPVGYDITAVQMKKNTALKKVVLKMTGDLFDEEGYYTSVENTGNIDIEKGILCEVLIVTGEGSLFSRIFPNYDKTSEG